MASALSRFRQIKIEMKKILIGAIIFFCCASAMNAQQKSYDSKTKALAGHFVECSRSGNYNKTYLALRKIQKYQWKLEKEDLKEFYFGIHQAVADACDEQGISGDGKEEMRIVIDAMFSDELKEAIRNEYSD